MDKEKVKNGLECCSNGRCDDCPYDGENGCVPELHENAMRLIDQQPEQEEKYEYSRFIEIKEMNGNHTFINTKYVVCVLGQDSSITEIFLADDCGIVCTYESYENVVNKIKGDRK